jgi:YD repeat-containing protein
MATIKTIDFSTKPICPECGREIPTDEIDVEKDCAWCPNCCREMSFVEVADYSLVKAKWESWGFAMTNRVEGFGGVTDTTSWTYYTSGNGKGQVKTEQHQSGLLIQYAYDNLDRLISETRSGPDMMTENMVSDPIEPLILLGFAGSDPKMFFSWSCELEWEEGIVNFLS